MSRTEVERVADNDILFGMANDRVKDLLSNEPAESFIHDIKPSNDLDTAKNRNEEGKNRK